MQLYGILTDEQAKQLQETLDTVLPGGHEDYKPIALQEMILHAAKNSDYAAGGSAMGNFDRVSAILSLYPGLELSDRRVVALVYALKQLDAVLWGIAKKVVHKVEGLNERLGDISVYAKLVMCMNTEDQRKQPGVVPMAPPCIIPNDAGPPYVAAENGFAEARRRRRPTTWEEIQAKQRDERKALSRG